MTFLGYLLAFGLGVLADRYGPALYRKLRP